jgi:6-hydroxycyclohex-1-ene-1-carbonyl-CoA dehydrogenase
MGVRTDHPPPLSLGHEISGVVVAGEATAASYIGKEVIIPAVLPCNKCELCKTGRGNRCLAQKMPGNSMGIYGGFSSHIRCRPVDLCVVGNRGKGAAGASVGDRRCGDHALPGGARARPAAGDRVIVIGAAGGVGSFMTQVAKGMGAGR